MLHHRVLHRGQAPVDATEKAQNRRPVRDLRSSARLAARHGAQTERVARLRRETDERHRTERAHDVRRVRHDARANAPRTDEFRTPRPGRRATPSHVDARRVASRRRADDRDDVVRVHRTAHARGDSRDQGETRAERTRRDGDGVRPGAREISRARERRRRRRDDGRREDGGGVFEAG